MVQQGSLAVKAYQLAACSLSRVNSKYVLFTQRGCQQQLPQVFRENAYGLLVGFFLGCLSEFRLH